MIAPAERALVGQILRDPQALGVALTRGVRAEHFGDGQCREIFLAALRAEREGRPHDAFSLAPVMAPGFTAALLKLADEAPVAASTAYFADEVFAAAWRREVLRRLGDVAARFQSSEPYADQAPLKAALLALGELATADGHERRTAYAQRDLLDATLAFVEDRLKLAQAGEPVGIPTGFSTLDRVTHGFVQGRLWVVGARPGVGKTTFALNLALNAAKAGHGVAYVTHEMSPVEIGVKLVSRETGVASDRMTLGRINDAECDRIVGYVRSALDLPLVVEHAVEPVFETLVARARQLKRTHAIKVLVVDYVGQFSVAEKSFGGSRQAEVSYMTAALKRLAQAEALCVVAIAQINRRGAETDEPEIHHLKDSGSYEQDADHVVLLWQDDGGRLCVSIAKNRHGVPGKLELDTNLATSLVSENVYANGVKHHEW